MSDNINPLAKQSGNQSGDSVANHMDSQQNDLQASVAALTHNDIRNFVPTENCLDGKTILVTGAGDGIGRVAALTYARYGATMLLLGRTSSKLEYVYDEIESFGGKQPAMLPMNLEGATYTEMQKLANLIHREVGQLDGILHNAGMLGSLTPLEMYDVDMARYPLCSFGLS